MSFYLLKRKLPLKGATASHFWSYAVLQKSLKRGRIDGVEQAA
jgi:hypothetical protein